jgi:hypothetical protein
MTGALYFIVERLDAAAVLRKRDEATTLALARAKEALIAFAASANLTSGSSRPGDLPCPDRTNDGKAETSCGNSAGSHPERRLGRLPWQTLGVDDLRDGYGEHLWYAVSNNFKNNTRTLPLNSDTVGTITVRDANGNVEFDGTGVNGVVAVIIAPGYPLTRQDGVVQNRIAANTNDPTHYLDNIASEDNASFNDGSLDGFFSGPVFDPADPAVTIANDRVVAITQSEIMAAIEKRVAAEVMNCLVGYAAANGGRYPWAADLAATAAGNFSDSANTLFGRVPNLMCNTGGDGHTPPCDLLPVGTVPGGMLTTWGSVPNCFVTNNWFSQNYWNEQVFYSLASAYKPRIGPPPSCGTCLSVDGTGSKQVVVMVAGKAIGAQTRANKADPAQYLETPNSTGGTNYATKSATPPFNDRVRYFPTP